MPPMMLGFHTAGLLLHDESEAISELAKMGYRAIAIRPRRPSLDPSSEHFPAQLGRIAAAVREHAMELVVDTEGHFMIDPHLADLPALVSESPGEARAARGWVGRWIEMASDLSAGTVTFSAGRCPMTVSSSTQEMVLERLAEHLDFLLNVASDHDVSLALRPASGHAIATVAQFERLRQWLARADELRLAADIGEMLIGGELPLGDRLARNADALGCVYLCDRCSGAPRDRRVGQGDVSLPRVLASLRSQHFRGPAIIRVEGHSEYGLRTASEALSIVRP